MTPDQIYQKYNELLRSKKYQRQYSTPTMER